MDEEMVTITKAEYQRLLDVEFKMDCLEAGGVDNWDWYSESLKDYYTEMRARRETNS